MIGQLRDKWSFCMWSFQVLGPLVDDMGMWLSVPFLTQQGRCYEHVAGVSQMRFKIPLRDEDGGAESVMAVLPFSESLELCPRNLVLMRETCLVANIRTHVLAIALSSFAYASWARRRTQFLLFFSGVMVSASILSTIAFAAVSR